MNIRGLSEKFVDTGEYICVKLVKLYVMNLD